MNYEKMTNAINAGLVWWTNDYPGGAYTDGDYYFNRSGEQLRDAEEYNPYSEGYTPFGDE